MEGSDESPDTIEVRRYIVTCLVDHDAGDELKDLTALFVHSQRLWTPFKTCAAQVI